MFSRCSHCQALHRISSEDLRRGRGLLTCLTCGRHYDALLTLSDYADTDIRHEKRKSDLFLTAASENRHTARLWTIGCCCAILLLLAQLYHFEGQTIARQPSFYNALLSLCEKLDCTPPTYKNLDEWSLSKTDLQNQLTGGFIFTGLLTNHAAFPQAYPEIKLVLENFQGQPVAERVFTAAEYSPSPLLPAYETAGLSLNITVPAKAGKIGGYFFTLF